MVTNKKIPTVGDFLDSVGEGSLDDLRSQLAAYAKLGYHHDGNDRSDLSVRKLKLFVKELDDWSLSQLPDLQIQQMDDDVNDLFQIHITWEGYQEVVEFRSPTLANSFAPPTDQVKLVRLLIDRLGSPAMYDLPYLALPAIVQQGGKAAGFL